MTHRHSLQVHGLSVADQLVRDLRQLMRQGFSDDALVDWMVDRHDFGYDRAHDTLQAVRRSHSQ